ncbi:hypothetical protein GWK47_048054 [Chionoecetes opilio]|uniref:Transcription elongation factor, mitochondrial n=1 Tax=Chionoecetes opilio TaxID=41210 RepID=A0A8J4Y5P7_CHIOP|nr:hypothetical protein GWK47_048054 [Chionoecetes opilio]
MLGRVCAIQRSIVCAARRGAALPPPPRQHHLTTLPPTTTTDPTQEDDNPHNTTPQPNPRPYDPTTYRLPFNPTEGRMIMDMLNGATPHHLSSLGVAKGVAGRLLKHRERIGGFQELSQVLEVDGVGIRGAEGVCRCVLQGCGSRGVRDGMTSTQVQSEVAPVWPDLEAVIGQKRLLKPRLSEVVLKNMECFVALHVTAGFLAWVLCGSDGRIHSLATHPLLTANTRFDTLRIYEKVLSVTQEIPEADYYVWEDRASYSQLAKAPLGTVIVALQLAQIRGMLTALLGGSLENTEEEEEDLRSGNQSRLLFLKDSVVPKLFRLKMGVDRLSGLGVADSVMDGGQAAEWLSPVTLEPGVHEAYFQEAASERRYMASAVLVAVAFHRVVLSKNSAALRVLSQ